MGRKCSVEGCLSDSNRLEDIGVTFHKVPMHSDVRPKWMTLCRIPEDKKFIKIIYVCSRHFLRADFCNFKGKKYMLKQGVLPSVFPWDKSKLEAIKAEVGIKKETTDDTTVKTEPFDEKLDIKSELGDIKMEMEGEGQIVEGCIKVEPKEKLDEFEKSKLAQNTTSPMNFTINSRIEALDFNNEWYPARIVEVDYEENEVLIHFEKFSSKYDEWICMNSSRLRPMQIPSSKKPMEKYVVGERCLAAWSDARKFPATITKVMENDTYEVLFDDGFVKTLKAHRMSKTQGKILHSSPLFDPIKSSKQDRRDKKRKLNVAALFRKRPKVENVEEKAKKSAAASTVAPAPASVAEASTPTSNIDINWTPHWYKGKPVGIEATIETNDGAKNSVIVPDPRLPHGWSKHLLRRTHGSAVGKWDTIIVSPDNRKFRSKADIRNYIEQNPGLAISEQMFDFSLTSKRRRKSGVTVTKKVVEPPERQEPEPIQEQLEPPELTNEEEVNNQSLRILFEDDAYKCPIEGCGKNFRRENLAQMHVKHYHPEYTKFLDSTPNVADLAYARTVGENLDKSPGPSKPPALKQAVRTSTPKTQKQPNSPLPDPPELKPAIKPQSPAITKAKDAEIIKLLNTKPYEKKEPENVQPLPAGLPTNMYPDIKLKDLLTKSEAMPKRDDINLKTLCTTRPPVGIKTLLPVVRPPIAEPTDEPPKPTPKRKRRISDSIEIVKGKENPPPTITTPSQQPPASAPPLTPLETQPPYQQPQQLQPVPQPPPNDVIIEGGEVIKIVRMRQEEIINCTCGFTEEDGLMIQCELCLCWQHAYCNNIERESQVPEKYVCYICQHPLRERSSRKYFHDQDWLKQGTLPTGSYHSRDEETLHRRFEKLKKCHDLSGGLLELREYMNSLSVKMKIAEAKNHPKLYLWSKAWEKLPLPEKIKEEHEDVKPKLENDHQYIKNELDLEKQEPQSDSMLMMILKAGKDVIPKIDLSTLMDSSMGQTAPIIPQPEAAIDSADCRLNLLEHIIHQESLVEERLDEFEKQMEALEEGMNMEGDHNYPKTRQTIQLLLRDLGTLKEFSQSTTI